MSLLEVSSVFVGYGETEILHGVSVCVEPGEFVTIIGPNGSGKSTLMKTVFGLLTPKRGSVMFDDADITGTPPQEVVRLGLSYVPQSDNVFPSLTVQENLEMGAFIRSDDISQRVDEMYQLFPDLAERRRQRGGNLSGGQRQMLAFARAMMLDPRLLLLDEPSAGLAPILVETIFDTISRIRESGVAILIVEQNARQALSRCDRGYVLVMGENKLEGEARSLLDDPEVARVYLGG